MCDRYSCIFYLIPAQFALKTLLKYSIVHFLTLDLSKQNGVGCVLSNVITPSQRHNRTRRFREQKYRQNGQSGPQRFLYNNAGLSLSIFKFRPMFKQHVNLLIWTWIFVHLTMGVNSYTNRYLCKNIGITHVFSCINICRVPRMLFEHEADRPSVQHHPRDPASVNAMKQTCVIVILA